MSSGIVIHRAPDSQAAYENRKRHFAQFPFPYCVILRAPIKGHPATDIDYVIASSVLEANRLGHDMTPDLGRNSLFGGPQRWNCVRCGKSMVIDLYRGKPLGSGYALELNCR